MKAYRLILVSFLAACGATVVVSPPVEADDCECQRIEMTVDCEDIGGVLSAEFDVTGLDTRGLHAWAPRNDGTVFGPLPLVIDGDSVTVRCDALADTVMLWVP